MVTVHRSNLEERLAALVAGSERTMRLLRAGRGLGLASWCIGAGTIRSLVWDHLHGFAQPKPALDVDLVFYDAEHQAPYLEKSLELALLAREPDVQWDVANQATVHRWLQAQSKDRAFLPFGSLVAGIASWPEVATCVGVALGVADEIEVIAPHGLNDVFDLTVRYNPACGSTAAYRERVGSKRWAERWPLVRVLPWDSSMEKGSDDGATASSGNANTTTLWPCH